LSSTAMNSATETIPKVQPLLLRLSVILAPILVATNYLPVGRLAVTKKRVKGLPDRGRCGA
jgi:hypothetical protein